MADRTQLGAATVTRVVEWRLDLPLTMFPETPPAVWREMAPELSPTFSRSATCRRLQTSL